MRIKEHWKMHATICAAKARGGYTMIVRMPVAMADLTQYPGADRYTLGAVYALDGMAVVVPSSKRCGILVCEWSKWMRYVRRHGI